MSSDAEGPPRPRHPLRAPLLRYRVLAYVVGVVLLVLVGIAVPLRYIGGHPTLSHVVSPIHGFLYIVYLILAFDLAHRCRFTPGRTVLILLAGTIPFASFVYERKVTARVRAAMADPAVGDVPAGQQGPAAGGR